MGSHSNICKETKIQPKKIALEEGLEEKKIGLDNILNAIDNAQYDDQIVYTDMETVQEMFEVEDQISGYNIQVTNIDNTKSWVRVELYSWGG